MQAIFDAFWRAAAYCLHPRLMLWSLLPLLLAGGGTFVLGWFYWEAAVAGVRAALEQWSLIAPLIVVALAVPVVVLVSLLLVGQLMVPAIVGMVANRRFVGLQKKQGAGWWQGLGWALACTAAALAALVLSVPLWFVPPLVLVLPPLIWGWLTYRVFAFDVLALHASGPERRQLLRRHRWPLLAMGVVSGYLGALPSLLWAAGAGALILAPLLMVASVWLYTLVFAFAGCWFAHYALAALAQLRAEAGSAEVVLPAADVGALTLDAAP